MNSHQRRTERRIAERVEKALNLPETTSANASTTGFNSLSSKPRAFIGRMIIGTVLVLALLGIVGFWLRTLITVDSWINVALGAVIPFAMGWAGVYLAAKVLTSRGEKWLFICVFTALFILGICLGIWQQKKVELSLTQHRHLLNETERAAFRDALKAEKGGNDLVVQIACPVGDERTCVYAGQFISLFGGAGWTIDPGVQRLTFARAADGVNVLRRGGNKEYMMSHWDAGGWFEINEPHLLAVHNAFRAIHIGIDGQTYPDLGEKAMMIYFGPEREHETEPTSLTNKIEWAIGKKQGPFPATTP